MYIHFQVIFLHLLISLSLCSLKVKESGILDDLCLDSRRLQEVFDVMHQSQTIKHLSKFALISVWHLCRFEFYRSIWLLLYLGDVASLETFLSLLLFNSMFFRCLLRAVAFKKEVTFYHDLV